jgi:hypothetical protein
MTFFTIVNVAPHAPAVASSARIARWWRFTARPAPSAVVAADAAACDASA